MPNSPKTGPQSSVGDLSTLPLYELFDRTASLLLHRAWYALKAVRLTPLQAHVLLHTAQQSKPITPTQLANAFFVSNPTMSEVLRNLASRQYLMTTVCRTDRRVRYVTLTKRGQQRAQQARACLSDIIPSALLTHHERMMCLRILAKLGSSAEGLSKSRVKLTQE